MNENFLSLKRKILVGIIIKAVLLGLALGSIVPASIALIEKLVYDSININLCIICGLSIFVVTASLYFLVCVPTNKRIAKNLDNSLSLNEKVQTMLAYKDTDGAIFELQRNDTDNSLSGAKIKTIGLRIIIPCVLCILLAVGIVVYILNIPPTVIPPPEPEPEVPFEITQLQISAVEELIAYVSASEMDSPYRENVANDLTVMLDELKVATTEKERDSALDKAVNAIFDETDNSSNAVEILNELWKTNTDGAKKLAKALNYYDWPKIDEWEKFVAKMTEFRGAFNLTLNEEAENPEAERLTQTKMLFALVSENIITSLNKTGADENSEIYIQLMRLAKANEINEEFGTRVYGLFTLYEKIEEMGYKDTQREFDATLTALNNEFYRVMSQHAINTNTGEYAMTRISSLFGYTLPKFKRPSLVDMSTDDSGGSEGDDSGAGGGIGDGTVYGSDDLVYDPYTNTYVEYGTILDKYYALMFGKLQNGTFTDEEKIAMEKYFDILYSGFDESKTENEGATQQ